MLHMDMTKALAELDVLRGFIDFVNRQVGVYCDCLAGFDGNKVRVARQVARVTRPVSRRIENGQPVIVWASLEDPTRPDVIHTGSFVPMTLSQQTRKPDSMNSKCAGL
jgi:hypothetical protein